MAGPASDLSASADRRAGFRRRHDRRTVRSPRVVSWESLLENKSVDQMSQLNDSRRLRYVYYSEDLPSVVWIVIYPEYQGFARDDQHDASR